MYLRCSMSGRNVMGGKVIYAELEMGISFDTKVLEQLTDKLFALRDLIPEQGRIAYQLLPQDCKEMTDQLVEFLLSEVPEIRKCFDCYVDAKYKLSELYATDNKWLKSQKEKYGKEAKKILANRILSGVKTICRLGKEEKHKWKVYGMTLSILAVTGILIWYKYYNFIAENLNHFFGISLAMSRWIVPLGISFITFTAISYLVDVFRGVAEAGSLLDVFLYISFFPYVI